MEGGGYDPGYEGQPGGDSGLFSEYSEQPYEPNMEGSWREFRRESGSGDSCSALQFDPMHELLWVGYDSVSATLP